MSVSSSLKAMTFGNIIFGGIIGAGVDAATGAACQYPGVIPVAMDCGGRQQVSGPQVHQTPKYVKESAQKMGCGPLTYVGAGPQNSSVYSSVCEDQDALLTCDEKKCVMNKVSTES